MFGLQACPIFGVSSWTAMAPQSRVAEYNSKIPIADWISASLNPRLRVSRITWIISLSDPEPYFSSLRFFLASFLVSYLRNTLSLGFCLIFSKSLNGAIKSSLLVFSVKLASPSNLKFFELNISHSSLWSKLSSHSYEFWKN